MAEFLFEIGLEEVPARMIAGAEKELREHVVAMLERERLVGAPAGASGSTVATKSFSTPRRLAVWVSEVAARQADVQEEMTGPAVKIAYKDGVPTPAAVAFAKKAGVEVGALKTVTTPKGEYLAATAVKAGRAAAEVIAEEMPKELAGIYWAKNMVWRAGRPERFVRPVRWLVCLLGADVVPVSFGGKTAGRESRGHRVLHGEEPVLIVAPGEYEPALMTAKVMADVEARRHRIRKALDHVTRGGGRTSEPALHWREDHGLVDTVTNLTEWPTVVMGGFEPEFLALPEEVLVTVMRDHQKYFAVERGGANEKDMAKLAAHFLTVLNTETDAAGEAVIRHGNEKVLRARFTDAKFFWEFDQRVPLTERVALLEKVTFQKELGSYAAKGERVRELCRILADLAIADGSSVDYNALLDAATLAKTDLTTDMVKEFTELQGEVGGLYARAQGIRAAACDAIYDQYRPLSMEDRIPRTIEGQLLSVADKADTIAGMFRIGLKPTGSKDPFALRRAANGVVRILAEGAINTGIGKLVRAAQGNPEEKLTTELEVFLAERLEFYLREAKGYAYDVVKAVLRLSTNDVRDAVARAEAVTAVRNSEDFAAISAALKRMNNILAQNTYRGDKAHTFAELKEFHPAQERLKHVADEMRLPLQSLIAQKDYIAALRLIATLRPVVDDFFEQVMVMDPDETVKASRTGLLTQIVQMTYGIAEFSEIVTAG